MEEKDVGGEELSSQSLAEAVGAAAMVKDHLEKNVEDQCAYCGQHFPPDEIVVEREIYGQMWKFCDDQCLQDFMEHSNFQEENS